jgi:general secretion pathway protein J
MKNGQARLRSQEGFTLLELLISITILAFIILALSEDVRFAGRAWSAQEQGSARQGDINAVQTVLRQMIASGVDFEGTNVSLKFVGTLPAALARGGLFDIQLSQSGDQLILAWQPYFKGPSAGFPLNQASLLKGVRSFDLAYYVASQGWQHLADDKAKPPALIGIGLHFTDGRNWPSLVVAPAIDAPSAPLD